MRDKDINIGGGSRGVDSFQKGSWGVRSFQGGRRCDGSFQEGSRGCAAYIGIGGMKIEDEPRH